MQLIATYRCPRERDASGRKELVSRVMGLYLAGERYVMTGGKFGPHSVAVANTDINAHWAGYVSATRGQQVKPARVRTK